MAADDIRGTVPLSELDDFKVADSAPDVRGWDVATEDGREFGKVKELLVDTEQMRVRYLSIELDRKVAGDRGDRRILVPVGTARLDDDNDRVIVDPSVLAALPSLPGYAGGRATPELDTAIGAGLGSAGYAAGNLYDEDRFYGNRHRLEDRETRRIVRSEEELDIGKRRVQAGEVSVRKQVETERVRQDVPVTREEVEVERRPISADTSRSGEATITDDEIRVPVMEEEVVVEKRVVPKEEIVIRKHAETDTQEVEADVRRERVDVDDQTRRTGGTKDRARTDDLRADDLRDDLR